MDDNLKIISLTPPVQVPAEAKIITDLLESGVIDYVHLRHLDAGREELVHILESIPADMHPKIRIHNNFDLLREYDLAGAHLSSRYPVCDVEGVKSLTKSCHSLAELKDIDKYDYVTLSPIFSANSKPGYIGQYERKALGKAIKGKNVVALGGVSPSKFGEITRVGFKGAGMLGYIWDHPTAVGIRHIKMFRDNNFRLQYITNLDTPETVADEVKRVLDGGCKWVQIRMKDASDQVIGQTVDLVRPMCRQAHALLLIDDRVDLVAKFDVDGVHLGKEDMTPEEARRILGPNKIIGSTANTFIDIMKLDRAGIADYICLGPMRYSETKKKMAPTLGLEGILDIFDELVDSRIDLPITIMGGVRVNDVHRLHELGATGFAVNAAIRKSPDATQTTRDFLAAFDA